MSTFQEQIKRCQHPAEMMLVLAAGLDEVLAALRAQPPSEDVDPWSGWRSPVIGPVVGEPSSEDLKTFAAACQTLQNQEAIAAVEAGLAACTDPETMVALQAKLRLLKDDGASIDMDLPEGQQATVSEEGDGIEIQLPAPDGPKMQARAAWAHDVKLHEFLEHLTEEQVADAYAKGGPQWLYLGNRDVVMQMPVEWRKAMVADLNEDSPRAAFAMARDVLKDEAPDGARAASEEMFSA